MTAPAGLVYRRLRAPRADRSTLIEPPLEAFPALVGQARDALASAGATLTDVAGRSLAELRQLAVREVLAAAVAHTSAYRDVPTVVPDDASIFLAGHQPELFHTGVWFKYFVLDDLSRRHGAVAVNLLIDSDVPKQTALRLITGTPEAPRAEAVAFDRTGDARPYEERGILDRELFNSFERRALDVLRPLIPEPLLADFWPRVRARADATGNLGDAFAQARHALEGDWGLTTLELPQSAVCGGNAFRHFAAHVLAELPRFHDVFNSSLAEYREVNHVRSAAHPVPDLAAHDDFLETPFWIWTGDDPHRRPLFVARRAAGLELTDRAGLAVSLAAPSDGTAEAVVAQLAEQATRGVKLRTRALATTMFARLFVGDVFLHGIGGAKYDELTDVIIRRFFGIEPPPYLTISATLQLPIARPRVDANDLSRAQQELRELEYHPERFLDPASVDHSPKLSQLVETKRRWIATEPSPANARQRYLEITAANQGMQDWLDDYRRELASRCDSMRLALRRERLLGWREFAFCLFPEKTLRDFLLAFRANTS